MLRALTIAASLTVALLVLDTQSAHAIKISKNNPSRSFNISGINYGSVRWEQQRGNNPSLFPLKRHRRVFFFRR